MVKIERMSEGCKATIKGAQIFVGQSFYYDDLKTLEVTEGKVMYSVDELDVKEVEATQLRVEVKAPAPVKAPVKK